MIKVKGETGKSNWVELYVDGRYVASIWGIPEVEYKGTTVVIKEKEIIVGFFHNAEKIILDGKEE